jgi:succinyl-CoA synthetase beta subunit
LISLNKQMKLIEADGKRLLQEAGINVPAGVFVSMDGTVTGELPVAPFMVKSQVLQGRRGKNGLIVKCESTADLQQTLTALRDRLNGTPCAGFLCEPMMDIAAEWFVSVDVDRTSGELRASVSTDGGMGVENAVAFNVADVDARSFPDVIKDVIRRLSQLLVRADATHAEINPYAQVRDGSFVALDSKIELDDAAASRHPEWATLHALSPLGRAPTERERAYEQFLATAGHRGTFGKYLELEGDIALILSGGGASLLALDAMHRAGGRAANYLEVSGNPDPEKLRDAVKIALSKPGLRGIWMAGSFANFTDIQATCHAVLQAIEEAGLKIPVAIRRDGPNADTAQQETEAWAAAHNVSVLFHRADTSLESSARALLLNIV